MLASDFARAVTIGLLDGCNLTCAHCYRPRLADARKGTFRLTYGQIETALAEVNEFQRGMQSLPEMKVYFTGGEPCMWGDDGRDLVDVLLLVANRYHSKPRFDTNGVLFSDEGWCQWFLDRYFAGTEKPMKIIFSCDQFHRGSSRSSPGFVSCDGNAQLPALDRVLHYAQKTNRSDKLDIEVMWVSSSTPTHAFPQALRQAYPHVQFSVVPLLPAGVGSSLSNIAPVLRVRDEHGVPCTSRETLGAFSPHLTEMLLQKGKTEDQIQSMTNEDVFNSLSTCGNLPNPFFCWGGEYFYCIPRLGEPEFRVAEIGHLLEGIDRFAHADIKGMRGNGGILGHLTNTVHPERLDTCLRQEHSLRYVGCSFCRSLIGARRVQSVAPAMNK